MFATALVLYSVQLNPEFHADDDSAYAALISRVVYSCDGPGGLDRASLTGWVRHVAGVLAFQCPRGLFPKLHYGLAWAGFRAVGLPFSFDLMHFPIALASALGCVLVVMILSAERVSTGWAMAGGLLLLTSPIYAAASRGLVTYFNAFVPVTHAAALLAMVAAPRTRWGRLVVGIALAHLAASEILSVITLPLLAVAAWLATPHRRDLFRPGVAVPPLAMLVLIGTASLAALKFFQPHMLAETTQFMRIALHTSDIQPQVQLSLPDFLNYIALHFGPLFPLLLVAALVARMSVQSWRGPTGWIFGLGAGSAFGILFYVLARPNNVTAIAYQIYVTLPAILVFIHSVDSLAKRFPRSQNALGVGVAVLIATSAAAQASFVWNVPLPGTSALSGWGAVGTQRPNRGSKALGAVVRSVLEASVKQAPAGPIEVEIQNSWQSLRIYAGLHADPWWWRSVGGAEGGLQVRERIVVGHSTPSVHIIVRKGGTSETVEVTDSGRLLGRVTVEGGGPGLVPGQHDRRSLEALFDARWSRLEDYFPPAW